MKLNKQQRATLRDKYKGRCAYCGVALPDRWHADHIEPVVRKLEYCKQAKRYISTSEYKRPENNTLDNFNPSCPSCNIIKRSSSLEGFRKTIGGFIKSLNRDSTQYKFAKRYGLIKETETEVKFYFERI